MRRIFIVAAVLGCCSLLAVPGQAQNCREGEKPSVEIRVGYRSDNRPFFLYLDKTRPQDVGPASDTKFQVETSPTICRNQVFDVVVYFGSDEGTSKMVKKLKLMDFRASYTGNRQWRYAEAVDPEMGQRSEGAFVDDTSIWFEYKGKDREWAEVTLPTRWDNKWWKRGGGIVKVRTIGFTAEMTLDDNSTIVSFDPPWGEKP